MNTEYITYGISKFDPEKIKCESLDSNSINKPYCAFWASPVNADFSWADWCEQEGYGILSEGSDNVSYVKFKLKDAKIYHIKNLKDLLDLPIVIMDDTFILIGHVDFNKMREMGYDGIELHMDNYYFGHMFGARPKTEIDKALTKEELKKAAKIEIMFNSWDCDSIVLWNPEVIDVIEEKKFEKEKVEPIIDDIKR